MAEERNETPAAFRDKWVPLQQQIRGWITQLTTSAARPLREGSAELEEEIRRLVEESRQLKPEAVQLMIDSAEKRLIDFTEDDFRKYSPVLAGVRDPFEITVAELFLSYHARRERNDYFQWRKAMGKEGATSALTDQQFIARYGPPPWDLLNEALTEVGLEYRFNRPEGSEEDRPYEVRLTHVKGGPQIQTSGLSSGEKTLLAVAMSLYAGSRLGESIALPEILLMDEPDASLHPSMVRSLLRVVNDIFYGTYGVKVILATQSPSTVALAPQAALYTMYRTGHPRLRKASRDEALANLMTGLPTLSVRNEHRKQVFVESDDDEFCYQEMFRLFKDRLETPFSLEFIASGRRGQGNDVAVKHLVGKLRESGNFVHGILDRDQRVGAPDGIVFIERRCALENLVLDPLPVGLLLLRENFVRAEEVAGEVLRHFQIRGRHAQAICDYVVARVLEDGDDDEKVSVRYIGGFDVSIPRFYFEIGGHVLEDRLQSAFPQLNRYRGGLKAKVIELALADLPDLAPQDVVELFNRLISGA
jgi:hypothetical protein